MRRALRLLVAVLLSGFASPSVGQTIFDGPSVESAELRVDLRPRGEDRFAIRLTDKTIGRQVDYEFDGEGANDPEPFLMEEGQYCNTSVILLTIEFPWRHSLPQYARVLDTYAFRATDLAYIDMTAGSVTDIALLDSSEIAAEDMAMQPSILVEWDISSVQALDMAVMKFRRAGAVVEIIGMNAASETIVDRLALHDKPGALDRLTAH